MVGSPASATRGGAPDVAIIGGGIVGTAAAAILAEAGARVVLYERADVAAGASGRNAGLLWRPEDPALLELFRGSLARYRALADARPDLLTIRLEPAGILFLGRDPAALAARYGALPPDPEVRREPVDEAALRLLEPGLADGLSAWRVDIGYPVAPAAATRAFATLARERGAEIVEGITAAPWVKDGRALGVVLEGGPTERRAAGAVVAAAGPWTPALVDPTGRWRPIRPVWGAIAEVVLKRPPAHILEEDEEGAARWARPGDPVTRFSFATAGGISGVGTTHLEVEPDPAAVAPALLARAARFVPALAGVKPTRLRACARPVAADGRPLLGWAPGVARLAIASGHGPWGISLGPASAALVADLVLGRVAAVPSAVDPARFGTLVRA